MEKDKLEKNWATFFSLVVTMGNIGYLSLSGKINLIFCSWFIRKVAAFPSSIKISFYKVLKTNVTAPL